MSRLILLRHAKTESVSATGRDFDRGLTERGRRDAAIIGRSMAQAGLAPDRVLVSAARRAMQTWEGVRDAFPDAEALMRRELYLASREQLARIALEEAFESLLIIGHNPGLHEFAQELLGGDPAGRLAAFPTAAAAAFELVPGRAPRLLQLLFVRDHGGGAA
jgi:phosphohistidine phosphatase